MKWGDVTGLTVGYILLGDEKKSEINEVPQSKKLCLSTPLETKLHRRFSVSRWFPLTSCWGPRIIITPGDFTRGSVEPFHQEDRWLLITFTGPIPALTRSPFGPPLSSETIDEVQKKELVHFSRVIRPLLTLPCSCLCEC